MINREILNFLMKIKIIGEGNIVHTIYYVRIFHV